MRTLEHLLKALNLGGENTHVEIDAVVFDSRLAIGRTLFVAISGQNKDGHDFLQTARDQGCLYAVVQQECTCPQGMTLFPVKNTREALATLACAWYDNPSRALKLVGVTGTNGKTTTTTLLYDLFCALGYSCGLLSTVVNKIKDRDVVSTHTTPDPFAINALLYDMVQEGCTHCFMEVSSHAVHQNRIFGLAFTGGVFTNITHDHLDYHKTFSEYIAAKKGFFDALNSEAFALLNIDDKNGPIMGQNTAAKRFSYALNAVSDYKGLLIENSLDGLVMKINQTELYSKLIGKFNAYNLLAVFGVGDLLGIEKIELLRSMSSLGSVSGRFQFFKSNLGVTVVVDYAHTPDALENVLKTIAHFSNGGKVITLVGCGGDRDKSKRPLMARIAQNYSSQVILTSDNPRTENPSDILQEMIEGLDPKSQVAAIAIEDRRYAILTSSLLSKSGDIVLIAGKGHENYQEIKGIKHPFDDFQVAQEIFNQN
ncbi:MAG: UDP-N-acetylmuramoyl-L-alanyl-D-glutamate--2,6-diaminopimelate ligase [Bacteroidetes bacterium]|nr:UDP-N-acetylmuramoyl-L-alanyl-D-glutamate--2,6-diaminopimelate ligase [Bacteroidota bacterium]MBM3424076.1 UDP-N-acetylmuramoyl-L-alanyl-D-glutamate--2,6-diaminopimelate ligase [Bacteroidota bacterium]